MKWTAQRGGAECKITAKDRLTAAERSIRKFGMDPKQGYMITGYRVDSDGRHICDVGAPDGTSICLVQAA